MGFRVTLICELKLRSHKTKSLKALQTRLFISLY